MVYKSYGIMHRYNFKNKSRGGGMGSVASKKMCGSICHTGLKYETNMEREKALLDKPYV